MKNSILKDTMIITMITLIAGILLGAVYGITEFPIRKQKMLAKEAACKAVYTEAEMFGQIVLEMNDVQRYLADAGYEACTVDEIMGALDAEGNEIGYVFNLTTSEGYGGNISFAMGVSKDGTLNGISFLSISETAGLGMKANTDEFKSQYAGKQVEEFIVTKKGSASDAEIDAISGATVTSNAVTNAINAGLVLLQYMEGGMS